MLAQDVSQFDLSVVYVPKTDITVADCLSCLVYRPGQNGLTSPEETADAKRIIEAVLLFQQSEAKCFLMMVSCAELAELRVANVQAVEVQMKKGHIFRATKGLESVLVEDWSDDYANSDAWLKYWNAVGAPFGNDSPKALTEDRDKCFRKEKLLRPENGMQDRIGHWYSAQSMHPGQDRLERHLELRIWSQPGYYVLPNRYLKACPVCRATKHPNWLTAGNLMYRAIPESPMKLISMEVFAMSEGSGKGEVFDFVILTVDYHTGYIVGIHGKKSKRKDKRDKHGRRCKSRSWLTQ